MADDVFHGLEQAVARVAEALHRATSDGPSPLDVRYPASAGVLWRWVDAPQDAEVWAFVSAYTRVDDHAKVRSSLTAEDFCTLMTFSRRCVLAALRNEDPGAVESAFDALSAIDVERVDWRDVVTEAVLASYAARRLGLEPVEVLPGPLQRADPRVADILEDEMTSEIDLVGDWELRELPTPSGPVIVECDGRAAEETDLLLRALALAELVDADPRYLVESVGEREELPDVWLADTPEVRDARLRLRACVDVYADAVEAPGGTFLVVYLAETEEERHAEAIAAAAEYASDSTAQLGIAAGRRCAVVIAKTPHVGERCLEDLASLSRFREPIGALLV